MRAPDATDRILARVAELGFGAAGVCDARPTEHREHVQAWIAAGKHGSLAWLADDLDVRLDPAKLLPGAASVICVLDRYAKPGPDPRVPTATPRGRIARYARGDDYHVVVRDRLRLLADQLRAAHPDHEFRIACDLLPLLERELAARAGLGRIGKHTLLIEHGGTSYVVLGEILTTLALRTTPRPGGDPCGSCSRCIDACPTAAITPYAVDASRCLAYTTIEHRGAIPEPLLEPTGEWLFGCDICQEVCPHASPTRRKRQLAILPAYAEHVRDFDLLDVLGWTEDDRLAATMRSAVRRAKLEMLKRNALVSLTNAAIGSLQGRAGHAAWTPERVTESVAVIEARVRAVAQCEQESALVRDEALRSLERIDRARGAATFRPPA